MLGISIYPEKANIEDILKYIKLAHKYNYKRIFTCLLSVNKPKEEIAKEFTEIISFARDLDMEVILDVSPRVFSQLDISYNDLSFFADLGATAIRLDESFNGKVESEMTFNKYQLGVEINMSLDAHYLNTILDFMPNRDKLIGCHNFYPQTYTGLNLDFFTACSKRFKENNIRSCAFINAQSASVGPWEINEGTCTLEMHRNISSKAQLKHYYAMDLIDDIVIASQFADEEELKMLSEVSKDKLTFKIETFTDYELEKKIIFEEPHFNRGDVNDYLVRSTMSRVKYKGDNNPPLNTQKVIPKGSIVIGNDNFGQYKNELQIIKQEIIDDGKRNVVGKIVDEELFLLDLLKPWQKFQFEI